MAQTKESDIKLVLIKQPLSSQTKASIIYDQRILEIFGIWNTKEQKQVVGAERIESESDKC